MSISRKVILTVAGNRLVTSLVSRYGMKLGAARFVAGIQLKESIEIVKALNHDGLIVTLDLLGESVTTEAEATACTEAVMNIFDGIAEQHVQANVSVKLTQLGLDIDPQFCYENMKRIVAKAKQYNNFVRIDMEDSPRIDVTIDIFQRLLEEFGKEHVGLVVQSYLYRTQRDAEKLASWGANLRIVKGAYKEPTELVYPNKKDVDQNYLDLVRMHLEKGCYTAVATHDETIINWTKQYVQKHGLTSDHFEFQMLYGIRTGLQKQLVQEGYKVRVYTPFGKDWYPYFTRRIAERPANALFVLKSLFKK
ncbi:proline dehydrogenase family protein [Mechercharimyces sp. CAU 1602]|uniref:proline dehydrogenase family protein n=1 Tax=Mechercharimyces sp. CAU 1602 TaxID=2973933 RepID=UPI0021632EA0|nr:proline dehydrogenase family protein [Mechercharimyces sp. CAU 1602]MCS1352050.1 proline dehydrogenase family protein [Mechercharimyces sp. CAU 1602]